MPPGSAPFFSRSPSSRRRAAAASVFGFFASLSASFKSFSPRPASPPSALRGSTSAAGSSRAVSTLAVRRWVPGSKVPMESISSSKNSHRTGWSIRGENTSRMPPRRANCPTPSTCSHRVYPAESRASASAFRSARPPTVSVTARLFSSSGGMVRAISASAVVTTTCGSRWARAYSAARRPRSHSRELTAPGRNCHSRLSSVTGSSPVSVRRSPASWRTSRSSPQTNTAGRPAAFATAAPTQARCTGWRPVTAAGQPPSSTRRTSSAVSGIVFSCRRNCSIPRLSL